LPLECAVRLGRIFALDALRDRPVEIDLAAVDHALDGIRTQLSAIQGMKASLTSINTATGRVTADLDGLRVGILRSVAEVEEELRAAAGTRTSERETA
jgi:hypothetical protein